MTNDHDLQMLDAWNHAYSIPPDSVEAQRMRGESACPACGEPPYGPVLGVRRVEYRGVSGEVAEHAHECRVCGSVLFDGEDVWRNRLAWQQFRAQVTSSEPAKPSISGLLTVKP